MPNPNGRPSLYSPDHCDTVKAEMAKGYSLGAVAGTIGVTRETLVNWMRQHPEFFQAVKEGETLRQKQWETAAMINAFEGGAGNGGMIQFGLRNAGKKDWVEQVEVKHSGEVGNYDLSKLSVEQLRTLRATLAAAAVEPGPDRQDNS